MKNNRSQRSGISIRLLLSAVTIILLAGFLAACDKVEGPAAEGSGIPKATAALVTGRFPDATHAVFRTIMEDQLWEARFEAGNVSYYAGLQSDKIVAVHRLIISDPPLEDAQAIIGLELLANSTFNNAGCLQMPDIEKVENKPDPVLSKNHWNILISITPMNTSQVVRIDQQQVIYQNFSFPANFTREKVAYKFQTGIENRGFQFLVNYSQVRQFFDYELATKDFILDKQGNPIRKGLPKELNATLHFAGAGLRKNFELNSLGLKDYFINTGVDFSRELSSKQNTFWATVGLGRQIRLDQNSSITAGPYLEYSLNKLATGEAGLRVQPYQIGFSMILKYKINPKN